MLLLKTLYTGCRYPCVKTVRKTRVLFIDKTKINHCCRSKEYLKKIIPL